MAWTFPHLHPASTRQYLPSVSRGLETFHFAEAGIHRVVDRAAQQNCKLSRLFLLPFVVYLQGKNLKPQISRRHVVFVYIKACRLVFTLQTATAKTSVNSLLILSIYSQSSSECVSLMNESLFKELRLASLILTLDFVRSGERRKIFVLVILLQWRMHPYLLDTIYFNLILHLHLHMHQFALFAKR